MPTEFLDRPHRPKSADRIAQSAKEERGGGDAIHQRPGDDQPAPIGEKEDDVFKAELIHETVKILRMGAGMVVLVTVVERRRDRVLRCPGRQRQRQGVDGRCAVSGAKRRAASEIAAPLEIKIIRTLH